MLAILDYKAGNLTSVKRALDYLSIPCTITADAHVIAGCPGLIFPGVGAAGSVRSDARLRNRYSASLADSSRSLAEGTTRPRGRRRLIGIPAPIIVG